MKHEAPLSIKKWIIQNLFSLTAIGVAFVNIFLAYKLAPLVSDIRDVVTKVNAIEGRFAKHEDDNTRIFEAINAKLDQVREGVSEIKSRVSRIEGKLEK